MRIAVCCAMNQNRSMEAHKVLLEANYDVKSYGTNNVIKIPGESIDKPNIYDFDTTYKEIYEDLCRKNKKYYEKIGMISMLERNIEIKEKPENWFATKECFDIVFTAEEKVFTSIFENQDMLKDSGVFFLINFDIKDTISDSYKGAKDILNFTKIVTNNIEKGLENAVMTALDQYHRLTNKWLLFAVMNN